MTTHLWVLAVALAVTAIFDWRSVLRGDVLVERVTKPLVVLLLMGLATSLYWEGHALDSPRLLPVLVALGFSLVGDVALLHATEARFLVGLGAFLLAHVAYVLAIVETGGPDGFPWWLLAAVPALLLLHARVGRAIVRGASPDRGPVLAYQLALSALVLVAAWHGDWLVLLGAVVFAASDAVLGHDRFVREARWAPLTVVVSYHVAQTLIVVGLFR